MRRAGWRRLKIGYHSFRTTGITAYIKIGGTLETAAAGRGAEHAVTLLQGFAGVLQTDGYAAYQGLTIPRRNGGAVTLAHCWAHVRRRFYDIARGNPSPVAAVNPKVVS
jgi:hypothetical protein